MADSKEDIQSGKYKLHKLVLTNYNSEQVDISFLVNDFSVRETLSSLFLVYEFTIVDGVNLLERYLITGNEKLKLIILKKDTPDSDFVQLETDLVVTGIKNYSRPSNEAQVYKFTAISEAAFASSIKKISSSVSGVMTSIISELFTDISREQLTVLDDTAEGNFKIVLPNYSYADTFKLLLSKAQKVNGSPFYLFETLFHGNILSSYEEMVGRDSFDTYKQRSHDNTKAFSDDNFDINRTRIRSIDSNIGMSHFEVMNTGGYFSRTHALDYSKKEYRYNDYSIFDEDLPKIDKDIILDKEFEISGTNISDYNNAKQFYISENSLAFGSGIDNLNNRFENSVPKKAMVVNNQTAITHNITVDGDTRLRVGTCINIDLPPAADPEALPEIGTDDLLSGKFLISSIVHNFDKDGGYSQRVSLRKDSIDFNMIEGKY